ncbi:HlyD family efflux transporter periplasmic adaptor subunit [Polaribacter sp. BAL334]|uniref:efflux RND transporter periplasmic adaptor subunit n=1 Tax=Polaribacter sp. BAL334 TaxID=1708178 RepID=UPI0018D21F5A|nr:HlyD family efflux transporter periplasmic adaptor subunit [Polaribacter sp. BAL334]MBG7611368.1 HlyD family efflux transporter periplasmic adaptor subunit [Polaribacter sp. BAL334]
MKKVLIVSIVLITISITGCKQQGSIQLSKKNIVEAVFASGNITTEHQYIVTSQADGYLSVSFFNEGDSVNAGQILFRIENEAQLEQLENAEANYQYAKTNVGNNSPVVEQLIAQRRQLKNKLTTDSLNFVRYQKLVKTGAVSQVDYEKATVSYENAKQDLVSINNQISDTKNKLQLEVSKNKANLAVQQNSSSFYEINTEVNGVIFQIQKKQGELIKRGESIAEVGSGKFIAKLFIVEEDINKLKLGQEVYIELNTERKKSYKAYLSKIYPYFDNKEQSFIAEATFNEPVAQLKSGTQLQANIKINEKVDAIVLPTEYLLPGDFIMDKKNGKVKVTVGIRTTDWVEILSGADNSTTILLPK